MKLGKRGKLMNKLCEVLDLRSIPCVCCNRRRNIKDFVIKTNLLGICNRCSEKITFSQKGSSFEGSRYVSYVISPMIYEGKARNIVGSLKFYHNTEVSKLLDKIFSDFLSEYTHLYEFDAIVPVPLSKKRMWERGYNQAELIAQCISNHTGVPIETAAVRTRHTKRQSGLDAQKRFFNVQGAFNASEIVRQKRIILVDDVRTTGNTMDNCAKAMIDMGAEEVIGITATITIPKTRFDY